MAILYNAGRLYVKRTLFEKISFFSSHSVGRLVYTSVSKSKGAENNVAVVMNK